MQPLGRWPRGLKVVFTLVALAALISLIQAAALGTGKLPLSAPNLGYAGASVLSYCAAVALGVTGRRLAFFWSGLTVACVQLAFTGWYLYSTVKLLIDLQVSPFPLSRFELWNLVTFLLALALAGYLLLKERPRLRTAAETTKA